MVRMLAQGRGILKALALTCAIPGVQEDMVNPKCEAAGCALIPVFGFLGERPRRCKAHRLEGMVRMLAQGLNDLILAVA
jgi:hypothetical protein